MVVQISAYLFGRDLPIIVVFLSPSSPPSASASALILPVDRGSGFAGSARFSTSMLETSGSPRGDKKMFGSGLGKPRGKHSIWQIDIFVG